MRWLQGPIASKVMTHEGFNYFNLRGLVLGICCFSLSLSVWHKFFYGRVVGLEVGCSYICTVIVFIYSICIKIEVYPKFGLCRGLFNK